MINKEWLECISKQFEIDYGIAKKDEIIGTAESIYDNESDIRKWFEGFTKRLNSPDIKLYAKKLLEDCCPCRCVDIEENIRKNYEECEDLADFANKLKADGLFGDHVEIRNGILIATKRFAYECGITHPYGDDHYKKCHCTLGSIVNKPITDVFCCCCIGFYKKMIKAALGIDVKVELISSVITGGDVCSAAIYVPEKSVAKKECLPIKRMSEADLDKFADLFIQQAII